ncbi:MAG: ion transporter [Rhodospirillaceae bacterium]
MSQEAVRPTGLRERIGAIVMAPKVRALITTLIVFNAITLGLETSETVRANWGTLLAVLDKAVLVVFCAEIAAKLVHRGWRFFKEGWNEFDFVVVGIALVPAAGPFTVLRALRILRTLRLLSVVPQMRIVVQALFSALPAMASIVALISLIFYVGAVLTTNLFGSDFDAWFGNIGRSMYSLFQVMTLESWSMGIVRPVMEKHPYAWAFFIPFILITSFAIINLFIGVIVDSMQARHRETVEEIHHDALVIEGKLDLLERELSELRRLVRSRGSGEGA